MRNFSIFDRKCKDFNIKDILYSTHLTFITQHLIITGVYSERGFGGQTLFFWEIFFNLLGFFKKKNPKTPLTWA